LARFEVERRDLEGGLQISQALPGLVVVLEVPLEQKLALLEMG
jgi:hypothetical protein